MVTHALSGLLGVWSGRPAARARRCKAQQGAIGQPMGQGRLIGQGCGGARCAWANVRAPAAALTTALGHGAAMADSAQ